MTDTIRNRMRWIAVIFTVIWMLVIFRFSMDNAVDSSQLSMFVVRVFNKAVEILTGRNLLMTISPEHISFLEVFFRKIAHMTIYFILSITVMIFFFTFKMRMSYRMLLTLMFCFLYALSDEWHQTFVAGRAGSLMDALFDTSGAVIGIFAALLLYCIAYTLYYKYVYFKRKFD